MINHWLNDSSSGIDKPERKRVEKEWKKVLKSHINNDNNNNNIFSMIHTHTHKVCVFDWNENFFTIITYHYGNSTLKSHYQTTTTTVDNRLIIVMQNDYLSSSLLLSCEYRRILSDFQMLKFESNKQTNKLAVNNSTE